VGRPIHLAISTCPNDTFAFHGLMSQAVDWRGLDFHIDLLDIQQLNNRLFAGDFDVAKVSFHAALKLTQQTVVLPSGSALGYQVGPLLLAAHPDTRPVDSTQVTLCPGEDTTAALLFRLFHRDTSQIRHVVFSDIMPALERQEADFGVCIHEGRFTWQQAGLSLLEDLGTRWENSTGCPLPLGGIVARRSLPVRVIADIQAVIHDSLNLALADPDNALPTMRQYAQEFDDAVLQQHVTLYVNDWTVDLGETGRRALDELSARAVDAGICEPSQRRLEVFAGPQ
jgi:1,4-dihydroxy-6-naphthoate synthase